MAGTTDAPSLYLGNISPGTIRVEFAQSIQRALLSEAARGCVYHVAGPYLDIARNEVCTRFLNETTADYLLFVDSDISFEVEHVKTILADTHRMSSNSKHGAVVGGLYYGGANSYGTDRRGTMPIAYRWGVCEDNSTAAGSAIHVSLADDDPRLAATEPQIVSAVGTGFMCIPRKVLELFAEHYENPTPYFAQVVLDGVWMGEDLTFCVRAEALGVPVYLAPHVRVRHWKMTVV